MDEYSLAFSTSNLGPKSYQKILSKLGSSKSAWKGSESRYEEIGIKGITYDRFEKFRKSFDIKKYVEKLKLENISFISFLDKEYPQNLKKLENPPIGIFARGNLELLRHSELDSESIKPLDKISDRARNDRLSIAVVGTRKITSYGKTITESLVVGLTNNGACIVSGLALGVDATAHRVCLQNHGATIAVLACGVDCCSPSENYSLYRDILKGNGLIVSEYPLAQRPNKGMFLARNRIIAALSDGVLVTEAAEDSGSLVTADWAKKLEKKVFAVPGMITSRMSDGSLKLLKQGAKLVSNEQDILGEFRTHSSEFRIATQKLKTLKLNKEERNSRIVRK